MPLGKEKKTLVWGDSEEAECAAELHVQFAFAHKDLAGKAADDCPHHFGPSLRDAVLQKGRLQTLLPQIGQQDIANRGSFPASSRRG